MTKAININKRVAELSATLSPIAEPFSDTAFEEMWGACNDAICYNTPCYYDGAFQQVDWNESHNSCVLQAVGEYQVLRFFQLDVFMSGASLNAYYIYGHEHEEDDPDYNDFEPEFDELDVKNMIEYKQIWIDEQGNATTIRLAQSFIDGYESFVKVESLKPWASVPSVYNKIISEVNEVESFCYTNEDEPLRLLIHPHVEYVRNVEPEFYNICANTHNLNNIIKYYRSIKVAHRHGYHLPTTSKSVNQYFDYLRLLAWDNKCLTEPFYICPTDFDKEYGNLRNRADEIARKEEERRKAEQAKTMADKIAKEEEDFSENHAWLKGIEFDSDSFRYKSLDSVEEYIHEGIIMHHCIGQWEWKHWRKHHCLSLHIEDHEGNRVATCTIDLLRREIEQIQPIGNDIGFEKTYGITWQSTKDYIEIRNTLMARMHTFPYRQSANNKPSLKIAI